MFSFQWEICVTIYSQDVCVCVLAHLGAPEFHRPVKGGGDEEVGEVHGPSGAVAAEASDWTMVALEHLGDARLTATHDNTKDFLYFFCIC